MAGLLTPAERRVRERALETARREIADRHRRADLFGLQLVGPTAFDLLLEIFVAGQLGRMFSVKDAALAVSLNMSTAGRWLLLLEDEGHVSRQTDPGDSRRTLVELTPRGLELILTYLTEGA